MCLVAQPPSTLQHEASSTYIDVVRLSQGVWSLFCSVQALSVTNLTVSVTGCICLGRSPGWRRRDVEEAVRQSASV